MPWDGPPDPAATTRYYVTMKGVEPPLPYAAGGIVLHASAESPALPNDEGVHGSYPYFFELAGLRCGSGGVALLTGIRAAILFCDTYVDLGPEVCRDGGGTSVFTLRSDFDGHWGHHADQLPTDALNAMAVHGPTIHRLNRGDAFNPFANAWRLYTAGLRMLPSDVALVSFVSALEGLFTTASDNISYRFALAIGFFLGETREERTALIAAAKRVYTARSKTVHGAQLASSQEHTAITLADNLVPEAEMLCRRAFRRLLEKGLADFVKSSGKRDEFFTMLVTGYSIDEARQAFHITPITA
jgi:hypothetical protein